MNHLQQHFSMVKIVGALFGDSKKASSGGVMVNDLPPERAAAELNNFFGKVSK